MKALIFTFVSLSLVGCGMVRPVGPLAKQTPIIQQGQPLTSAASDSAQPPTLRPTPPTMLITPGEVDPNNPKLAADKLSLEVDTDSKATINIPVTVQTSRVKNGISQP
jgi:hypothetical protein